MNSFAMIFGKCVWIPPSPKAALLALSYFFGTIPSQSPAAYEVQLRQQIIAAGASEEAAAAQVKWLNECFGSYVITKQR
jgi:hypothetical protein